MVLFTNGCSWTWGGGLNFNDTDSARERAVWPWHLGKLMNVDQVINLAVGCGSNQRIVRTTYDWILNQTPETLKNTVAVIQWTGPYRYEYYVPAGDDPYENLDEHWVRANVDVVITTEKDIDRALRKVNERLSTQTDIESLYTIMCQYDALSALFARYGVKYYYWRFPSNFYRTPVVYRNYITNNFNWLPNCEYWEYDKVSERDSHPSINGHKQIANFIFNGMNV